MPDIGHGTTLGVLTGSVYNNIGKIVSLSGPTLATDVIDATAMDSAGGFKTFIKGLKDWGEFTFSTIADPDPVGDTTNYYDKLVTAADADTTSTFKITFPNSTTLTFAAYVTGLSISANPSELITTDVTLKVSGDITWA